MNSLRRCVVGAGAVALAMAGGSQEAHAAGIANTGIGGEEGTVVSTNPTALLYNPGAMGFSKGSQLAVYGQVAIHHATYERPSAPSDIPDPAGAEGANVGTAHLFNVSGGPAIGGTLKLGNLVLGGGFFAPFGGSAHWQQNDAFVGSKYPLAAGGVQRWFAMDGHLQTLYFTAGAAYRLGPLSIGATGNFISTTVNSTDAKNPSGLGLPDTSNEGRAFLDAQTFNGSFGAGAMLEVVPDQLYIGASYQAQPGLGTQTLKGQLIITSVSGVQPFNHVGYSENLPDVVRAGIRWRPKGAPVEFRVFGDYTRWSLMKDQCLGVTGYPCGVNPDGSDIGQGTQLFQRRDWNDTYAGRLGVSVWVTPEIELLFGGGYETAAIPDSTLAPDFMDAINIRGTLGGRFKLTDSLFIGLEYTHIQYLNRNNIGKSQLAVNNGTPVLVPEVEEDAGGTYTQWLDFINANLEALF